MSLLKTNEIQNYNGSSLTLTASTVSTSAQLNTGGNISVTGSLNVSDDSTTRTNLGLGTIATQDSDSITVTGGSVTGTEIDLKSSGTTIFKSDGTTAVLSESSGTVTLTAGAVLVGTATQIGLLTVNGTIASKGYQCHSGVGGSYGGNSFNIYWTGSVPQLWIDATNIGNIQVSSDYRIKKNIETQTASGIDRVMRLRPVTYEIADYGDLFRADGIVRDGFIAHEVQEVIPSGAEGQKDEEGRIQNLRTDAILSVAIKAIQEQQTLIESQQSQIDTLTTKTQEQDLTIASLISRIEALEATP